MGQEIFRQDSQCPHYEQRLWPALSMGVLCEVLGSGHKGSTWSPLRAPSYWLCSHSKNLHGTFGAVALS